MLVNAVLTPAESKKLIAKAVLSLPEVQSALNNGILVMHPSSTTAFIYEEITGNFPTDAWVFGVVSPKGLCRSSAAIRMLSETDPAKAGRKLWIFRQGKQSEAIPLKAVLTEMNSNDVFIKAGNALDHDGRVATITSKPETGGTTGTVQKYQESNQFHVILPTGIEKTIPISISEMLEFIGQQKPAPSMGLSCGMYPAKGKKIDEVDAISLLTGAKARVCASGGIAGAEGSIVLYVQGEDEQVQKAWDILNGVKGTVLPIPELPNEV